MTRIRFANVVSFIAILSLMVLSAVTTPNTPLGIFEYLVMVLLVLILSLASWTEGFERSNAIHKTAMREALEEMVDGMKSTN